VKTWSIIAVMTKQTKAAPPPSSRHKSDERKIEAFVMFYTCAPGITIPNIRGTSHVAELSLNSQM
jgi:hypothetical protein